MSQTLELTVCCNPLGLSHHDAAVTEDLRHPSKKVVENHPWLSIQHLVCGVCRCDLNNKYAYSKEKGEDCDEVPDADEVSGAVDSQDDSQAAAVPPSHLKTVTYEKVVVPRSLRSKYWKHYGFPADKDSNIITKNKVVCMLCKDVLTYIGDNRNLRPHLALKHPEHLNVLETTKPNVKKRRKKNVPPAPDVVVDMSGVLEIGTLIYDPEQEQNGDSCSNNDNKSTKLVRIIRHRRKRTTVLEDSLKLVSSELLPLNFIQSRGLVNFIQQINPAVTLPTAERLKNESIPLKYNELRHVILCEISKVTEMSLSVEEWTGIDDKNFVTFSANYLIEDKLITRILRTLQLNEINNNSIANTFSDWGLQQEHIVSIVTSTQQAVLIEALRHWAPPISCFQFTIQQAVSACFTLPKVKTLLWKCRAIKLKYFNANNQISKISFDYPKIWTSTYDMLKEFANFRADIDIIAKSDDIKLSKEDWTVLKSIVDIFSPFKLTSQTLQEQSSGFSSIIKPLIWQLTTTYLQITDNDTEFSCTTKTLLKTKLLFAYDNQTTDLLLKTAATLDPRFKQVSFFDISFNDKTAVELNIKTILSQYGSFHASTSSARTAAQTLSTMDQMLLGAVQENVQPPPEPSNQVDTELSQFTSESSISFDQSPLLWWREAEPRYPTLYKLARTFMCIPACAIPASKITRDQREAFERQRVSLSVDLVDKLVFLNENFV